MACACVDRVFDDKRLAVTVLLGWMVVVVSLFGEIGLLDTKFMRFGPSETAVFMGVQLDTVKKWGLVASFTFVNTCFNDFMSDAINPFLLNTIADHKTRYIPYPKYVCLLITQSWAVYCNIMSVFGLFLAMTQVDFVLIRATADLLVNVYTNMKYMRHKVHDARMYNSHSDLEMCAPGGDAAFRQGEFNQGNGAFSIGEAEDAPLNSCELRV